MKLHKDENVTPRHTRTVLYGHFARTRCRALLPPHARARTMYRMPRYKRRARLFLCFTIQLTAMVILKRKINNSSNHKSVSFTLPVTAAPVVFEEHWKNEVE